MQQVAAKNANVIDNAGGKPVNAQYGYYPTAQINTPKVTNPIESAAGLPGADFYNGVKQSFARPLNTGYTPSVGAVNIQIYNPSVSPIGQIPDVGISPAYNLNPPVNNTAQSNVQSTVNNPPAAQPVPEVTTQQTQEPAAAANIKSDSDQKESKTKKKEVMMLTDDYIRTLENHLNNPNAEIRYMGAKEVFDRFKEDDSRKTDIPLTNLLNKALQDKSSKVRFIALAALNGGYAAGDQNTVEILKNMQKSDSDYNQDALTASQALLKMVGNGLDKKTIEVPDNSDSSKGKNK